MPEKESKRKGNSGSFKPGHKVNLGKKGYWNGKKHGGWVLSAETRKKMSDSRKGEKSYLWRGGITPENKRIRNSVEYKLWREAVFERDNWTCIWCGVRSAKGVKVTLNADHIKPFAYFPELRFALDNGRTLCADCHRTTDTFSARVRYKIIK